ncbi:hypothetical protein BJ546DRAFT_949814 [Cryomyces antarcticus]
MPASLMPYLNQNIAACLGLYLFVHAAPAFCILSLYPAESASVNDTVSMPSMSDVILGIDITFSTVPPRLYPTSQEASRRNRDGTIPLHPPVFTRGNLRGTASFCNTKAGIEHVEKTINSTSSGAEDGRSHPPA